MSRLKHCPGPPAINMARRTAKASTTLGVVQQSETFQLLPPALHSSLVASCRNVIAAPGASLTFTHYRNGA